MMMEIGVEKQSTTAKYRAVGEINDTSLENNICSNKSPKELVRDIYVEIRILSKEAERVELVRFPWPAKQFPFSARSRLRCRFRFRVRLAKVCYLRAVICQRPLERNG